MNNIELKPISELLEEKFYISSYQRGYRWTQRQIEDLLNDIYGFAKKKRKTDKEFYCLQPIIVKEQIWKNPEDESVVKGWDVIDGQQRLTTIRIILTYLINEYLMGKGLKQRYGKDLYSIEYQTRPDSKAYLDRVNELDDTDINFYHMGKAYEYVDEWFKKMQNQPNVILDDIFDSIIKTLVYNRTNQKEEGIVQVIWYELRDEKAKPIETFIRINLGKISLTNSELIKALFLQERNFGEGDGAKLKQLQIAAEWDQIENKLQGEDFWWFLNKYENDSQSHIEFIFDMMCDLAIEQGKTSINEIGSDDYATFRYFSSLFNDNFDYDTIKNNWNQVKRYFDTFVEWFEHPEWYHYIGFLVYCGESVQNIYGITTADNLKTKDEVTDKLISLIKKKYLSTVRWEKRENDTDPNYHLNVGYDDDKILLRRIFLLFNIEYIVKKSKQQNLIYKFPFKAFKFNGKTREMAAWDIEHIDSSTENLLKKDSDKILWLQNALEDVPEIKKDNDLLEAIELYINDQDGSFEELFNKVRDLTGETKLPDELKNSLGNLTLLDAGTNRGYGNALFVTKRKIIIEKDRDGVFIPLCTKNVFLKYFNGSSKLRWTESDIKAYSEVIEQTLSKFLIEKPSYEQV